MGLSYKWVQLNGIQLLKGYHKLKTDKSSVKCQSDCKGTNPLSLFLSWPAPPIESAKNIKIAIMFRIVRMSHKCVPEDNSDRKALEARILNYANSLLFTGTLFYDLCGFCIEKYYL